MDRRRAPGGGHRAPGLAGAGGAGGGRVQAADALPLPIRWTNAFFVVAFITSLLFLNGRWADKSRTASPLHILGFSEMFAIVSLVASIIYLINFFGIDFVQGLLNSDNDDPFLLNPNPPAAAADPPSAATPPPPQAPSQPKAAAISDVLLDEDDEIVDAVVAGTMASYSLESKLGDCRRAAGIRRESLRRITGRSLEGLPLDGFDYDAILGQCCELPIGYVQLPVGVAGPLLLNGVEYYVPMATTEGCLVASTNRGCKAIAMSGGVVGRVVKDGMSRSPVVRMESALRAFELKQYLEDPSNFDSLAAVFNQSSRFARLQEIRCWLLGRYLYIRFVCTTGDAMGMNMVSKGVQYVLDNLQHKFQDMEVISISGNVCSDKKAAAINWIEGRGKSVFCEAVIKGEVVKKVLKTDVQSLVELNTIKNLAGSAVAGSIGSFNAHASNIVSAIYIATGQDPAQNVESSHCITMLEAANDGNDLRISVNMPSIEVGTVGGGTQLASQSACLDLLGVKGANAATPSANSKLLATVVAGSVLAGELSLLSALAAGQLVRSHMKYNRSSRDISKAAS